MDKQVYRVSTGGGPVLVVMDGHYWHHGCAGLVYSKIMDAELLKYKPALLDEKCGKCGNTLKKWLVRSGGHGD